MHILSALFIYLFDCKLDVIYVLGSFPHLTVLLALLPIVVPVEVMHSFYFVFSYCSHEIKRRLLLGIKVMTNLDGICKSRDITLPTKVHLVKAMVFQWSCMDVRVGL